MVSRATTPIGEKPSGFGERSPYYVPQSATTENWSDIDLLVVLRHLWRSRWFVVIGGILGFAITMAALLTLRSVGTAKTSYNSAIVLTFPNRESGRYPNGVAYSPTDLLSPAVLSEVYERNGLEADGVTLPDFMSLVSTAPYSPLSDSLVARYRAQLSARDITFEERRAIEAEFGEQLAVISRNGVLITLQVPASVPISADGAQKILADIPAVWSDIYVNRLGAVSFGAPVSGGDLVDEALLTPLDYPLQADYIQQQIAEAFARIRGVSELPGAETALLSGSGKSITDLQRQLEAVDDFLVARSLLPVVDQGLSRTPDQTILSYQRTIRELQLARQNSEARSEVVTQILRDAGGAAGQDATAETAAAVPGAGFTQVDGSLIDRILKLSSQGSELDYRQVLLGNKLDIENKSIDVSEEIAKLNARVAAIRSLPSSGIVPASSEEAFKQDMAQVTTSLNTIWNEVNRLHQQLGFDQLSADKSLYKPAALEESARISQPALVSIWNSAFTASMVLVGAMLGFVIYLWFAAVRRRTA